MGLRYLGNVIKPGYNPLASNITTGVNTAQYQGVFTLQQQAQAQNTQAWTTDPLFENATLLIQADGTVNGAQNNTFLDSSSNAFAITRNGNTTQGSFTPFSLQPGAWGNFFDGTDDFLQKTSPAAGLYDWTSTNWTLEYWIYANAFGQGTNTVSNVVGNATDGGSTVYWSFGPIASGVVRWYYYNGGSVNLDTSTVLSTGRWHHLAFVNNSNTLTVYVDGVASATAAKAGTPQFSSGTPFTIGKITGSSFNGYISNLRITQSAVYTANFTPSSIPLSPISGTQLMTCQSNRFLDNSTNAVVFTPSGTPSVQAFSPFAPQYQWTSSVIGGSGYFDGTGDYLSIANNAALNVGSGDFCIEAWFNVSTVASQQSIVSNAGAFGSDNAQVDIASGNIRFASSATVWLTGNAVTTNTWNHVAVSRSGTTMSLFLNGSRQATATNSTNFANANNYATIVGGYPPSTALFTGYISNVRIVKGSSVYDPTQTTLTLPTAPLTAITNTSLLCNFTNAGIYDGTMKNNLETVGNAQVSTAVVKYGSGSMYFDGTGDNLIAPFSQNLQLGTGDFTIEFWINASASGSFNQVVGTLVSGTEAGTWRVGNRYNSTNAMYFARGTGAGFDEAIYGNVNVNDGLWHHVACVRIAGVISMYVDGVARTVTSGTASISGTCSSSNAFYVGYNGRDNSYITGYLDDVRITRGIARYTQNFIPPSVALPRQ